MSEQYAYILTTSHEVPHLPSGGVRRYYTYEWKGKAWWPCRIDRLMAWETEQGIVALPFKLRRIDNPYSSGWYATYVREDGWLYPLALLSDLRGRVHVLWLWFFIRLILTAEIWGWAYFPEGANASWKHFCKNPPTVYARTRNPFKRGW